MLADTLSTATAKSASAFTVREGAMDATLRAAVGRMLEWCARSPHGAAFMARGLVIDTMGDIGQQIRDHFPTHVDVAPVLDDISFVVAENAQASGQQFQEIALDYIGDGKIPQAARANLQTFVKWYGIDAVIGGDFDGHDKKLRPGWSGGAGTPTDMLKYLNLGTKKGFLLQVCALDITDGRAKALLADMPIMQAFGGSPAAIAAAAETVSKGGPEAEAIKTVAQTIAEIKTIRAALTNAGDTPQAAPIAAALALKTEALVTTLAGIKTPAPVKAEIARGMEGFRVELQARQVASVIDTIARTLPPAVVARTANDMPATAALPVAAARAVETLLRETRAVQMPVHDAIALTMTKQAPPAIADAVKDFVAVLAKPEFLPAIERTIPAAAATTIRTALTMPAAEATMTQATPPAAIAQNMQKIAASLPPETPVVMTLKAAGDAVKQTVSAPPVMRGQTLQAVAENLQAAALTRAVPPEAKPAITVLTAQVEAAVVQARAPKTELPATPAPLDPQSTLAVIAKAVDVPAPAIIPPVQPQLRQTTPAFETKAPVQTVASPVARATEAAVKAKPEAKKDTAKGPCPDCKKGFNCQACMAMSEATMTKMEAMMGIAPATRQADYRPKVA